MKKLRFFDMEAMGIKELVTAKRRIGRTIKIRGGAVSRFASAARQMRIHLGKRP